MWLRRFRSGFRLMPRAGRGEFFRINLSRQYRPYVASVRPALVLGCWLLFGGILWGLGHAGLAVWDSWNIQSELDRVQQQDGQLIAEAQQEGIDVSDTVLKRFPAEVTLANYLLEKRTVSWTAFLAGLEEAVPERLAINGIRLDPASSIVHLTGVASSLDDVTALTVGLQHQSLFKDPVLAQHRVEPNGLVEFDVMLRYQRGGA